MGKGGLAESVRHCCPTRFFREIMRRVITMIDFRRDAGEPNRAAIKCILGDSGRTSNRLQKAGESELNKYKNLV